MNFVFVVTVSCERSEGKFASREEIAEQIQQAISDANPGEVEGENGGRYEIGDWDVQEEQVKKGGKR